MEKLKSWLGHEALYWLDVEPMPKPTISSSDRWKRGREMRPQISRYLYFKDRCALEWRATEEAFPSAGATVAFFCPVYRTWSKRKKMEMIGQPHQQKRSHDIDNLLKGFFDALMPDDSRVYDVHASKWWWYEGHGGILVGMPPDDSTIGLPGRYRDFAESLRVYQ